MSTLDVDVLPVALVFGPCKLLEGTLAGWLEHERKAEVGGSLRGRSDRRPHLARRRFGQPVSLVIGHVEAFTAGVQRRLVEQRRNGESVGRCQLLSRMDTRRTRYRQDAGETILFRQENLRGTGDSDEPITRSESRCR